MTPTLDPLRLLEHVHGHLGWLAAAALVHPAILLRHRRRRAHVSVALAVTLVTAVGGLGVAIYGDYRDRLKQSMFIHAPRVGWLFERKEHLAFGAVVLAWAGAFAYFASRAGPGIGGPARPGPSSDASGGLGEADGPSGPDVREALATFAFRAFVVACVLALATAALGTVVAVVQTF